MFKEPMPFFEWLNSPVNKSDLEQTIAPGQGKVRTVNLRYRKRLLESNVAINQPYTCAATETIGDCLQPYTIDTSQNIQESKKIPVGFLNTSCQNNADYFMETLMMMIDVLERKAASNASTQAGAAFGKWATDVAVTSDEFVVNTLKPAAIDASAPNPLALQYINTALIKTGYCAPWVGFGGDKLYNYIQTMRTGCCSSTGVDLAQQLAQFGMAWMYDRRIMNSIGTFADQDKGLIVMNGALQLLTWNQNDWKVDIDPVLKSGQNYFLGKINSPRTGIPIDINVKDDCGVVSIVLTFTGKVISMPLDMFPVGDIYQGVNFVNKVKVTNT
jgi:hypothetical protein